MCTDTVFEKNCGVAVSHYKGFLGHYLFRWPRVSVYESYIPYAHSRSWINAYGSGNEFFYGGIVIPAHNTYFCEMFEQSVAEVRDFPIFLSCRSGYGVLYVSDHYDPVYICACGLYDRIEHRICARSQVDAFCTQVGFHSYVQIPYDQRVPDLQCGDSGNGLQVRHSPRRSKPFFKAFGMRSMTSVAIIP